MSTLVKSSNLEIGARKVPVVYVAYHQTSGSSAPSDGTGVSQYEGAFDLANNKMYAWIGAAWVDLTNTVFGQATIPNGTRIVHAITGTSTDVTNYTQVQSTTVWKIVGGVPVVEKQVREGDSFTSYFSQVYVGTTVFIKPNSLYTNDSWVLQGLKQSSTIEVNDGVDTQLRIKQESITDLHLAPGAVTSSRINLGENNLLVGNAFNQASELPPSNNSLLVTDGSGIPQYSTALPAGTTASTPTLGTHVVPRSFVDSIAAGFGGHLSVRAATTGVLAGTMIANNGSPITGERAYNTTTKTIQWATGEGPTAIDGVTLANGDRIMVKNETATSGPSAGEGRMYNGIYVRTSQDIWTRASDFDNSPTEEIMPGDFFPVQEGTTNSGSQWYQVDFNGGTDVLDTDIITFTQFSGSGAASLASLADVTLTGPVQYQALVYDGAEWINGQINLAQSAAVTGTLPIANGGTNSSTALNNNRIMVSSGGAIVEAAALTDGQILIGSTGNAPAAATLTAGSGISITNGAGTITIAQTSTFTFVDGEVPSGDLDGVDTTYTLVNAPSPASSLKVYLNGIRQKLTEDYTLSGSTITFVVPPESGDLLLADYRY